MHTSNAPNISPRTGYRILWGWNSLLGLSLAKCWPNQHLLVGLQRTIQGTSHPWWFPLIPDPCKQKHQYWQAEFLLHNVFLTLPLIWTMYTLILLMHFCLMDFQSVFLFSGKITLITGKNLFLNILNLTFIRVHRFFIKIVFIQVDDIIKCIYCLD